MLGFSTWLDSLATASNTTSNSAVPVGSLSFWQEAVTSQAFWEAIAAIGTIISLIFIYRQISNTKNVTALDFLLKEDARFRSPRMKRSRSNLAHILLSNPENYDGMSDYADDILDYFENLGMMLRKRIVDEDFLWTFKGYWILCYWTGLEKYVEWSRKRYHDGTLWSEFERLSGRISKVEIKNNGEAGKSSEEMLEFLEDDELHLQIEPMTLSCIDRIAEIERFSFNQSDAYTTQQFKELYEKHRGGFLIATILGEVVGYAVGYVENGIGLVDSIAVDQEFLRLGIGRKLLNSILEKIRTQGVTECCLQVRTTNSSAISFYEKMDFKTIETLKKYYGDGADAYLMKRSLLSSGV